MPNGHRATQWISQAAQGIITVYKICGFPGRITLRRRTAMPVRHRGDEYSLLFGPPRRSIDWAYYQRPQIRFEADNGPTDAYAWGRRSLEFHRCRSCGCVTHWSAVDRSYERMGVNARLMSPEVLAKIPVSHFDGASN